MSSVYHPLNEKGRDEDGSTDEEEQTDIPRAKPERFNAKTLVALSFAMLLTSILILVAAYSRTPSEMECAKRVSPWSSMWDAIELWEGDPTNYWNHSTIYRGPPTPEREEAWLRLYEYPQMPVSDAGIAALNKSGKGEYIEVTGSDPANPTYGAIVEVFHQLHCLNLIRQYTWFLTGHYDPNDESIRYPGDFINPVAGRMHVDHCIEALRIDFMCYSDITPVLLKYDDTRAVGRVADFSVHHKCRKFDKVVDWIQDNGVNIPAFTGTAAVPRPTATSSVHG